MKHKLIAGAFLLFLILLLTCQGVFSATVWTFDRPTTRTDGSPLTQQDISHYEVEIDGTPYPDLAGTATSLSIAGLDTSDHCLILRTVDTGGRVSSNSNPGCKAGDVVVLPPPPPEPPPAGEVLADGWTVLEASSWEIENWHMPPECLFDRGEPCGQSPIWHSRYSPLEALPPHSVTIDLGATYLVTGFRYLPRQGGGNGTPKDFEYALSIDGQAWTTVARGNAPGGDFPIDTPVQGSADSIFVTADGSATARYVRLTILSEQDGGNQAAVDELYVFGSASVRPNPLIMVE